MTWRKEQKAKAREKLLSEARDILKGRTIAKASHLYNRMNITGAMGASLLRRLGFVKTSSKYWEKEEK